MPYTPNSTWADGSGGGTPVTAARLNNMEAGITAAIAPPCAHVYHNTTQSIPNSTFTTVTFNSELFDTDGVHSTTVNTSRLTCVTTGKYLVTANIAFAANATGYRRILLRANAATDLAEDIRSNVGGSLHTICSLQSQIGLTAGDYIEILAWQDSGGALNVTPHTAYTPEFSLVRVA
jgi:hypothetical protein